MNQQNKIYGKQFCTVGIVANNYDGKEKYEIDDKGFHYMLNKSTLSEYEIDDSFVDDFIRQMAEMGTIAELRLKLGMEDWGGPQDTGIVLHHKDMPHILAHVQVKSGPKNWCPNPRSYQWPNDLVFHCYVDDFTFDNKDNRDLEDELNVFNALSHSGIGNIGVE
jgi:hypothetical protein